MIVGGASLLDHTTYRAEFNELVRSVGLENSPSLILAGVMPDEEMPSLFRLADAMVFPSFKEGFGLVVLEAMASGTPVVCPGVAPFIEYLERGDAVFVDPADVGSIAEAMRHAVQPRNAAALREAGLAVSRRFGWNAAAEAHERLYSDWIDPPARSDDDAGDVLSSAMAR